MSWARGQREGSAVGIQAGVGMGVDASQAHVGILSSALQVKNLAVIPDSTLSLNHRITKSILSTS